MLGLTFMFGFGCPFILGSTAPPLASTGSKSRPLAITLPNIAFAIFPNNGISVELTVSYWQAFTIFKIQNTLQAIYTAGDKIAAIILIIGIINKIAATIPQAIITPEIQIACAAIVIVFLVLSLNASITINPLIQPKILPKILLTLLVIFNLLLINFETIIINLFPYFNTYFKYL